MIEEGPVRGMRKLFLKNSKKKNFQETDQLLFKLFFQEKPFNFDLVASSQKEKRPSKNTYYIKVLQKLLTEQTMRKLPKTIFTKTSNIEKNNNNVKGTTVLSREMENGINREVFGLNKE
jgi:hypothetical protein